MNVIGLITVLITSIKEAVDALQSAAALIEKAKSEGRDITPEEEASVRANTDASLAALKARLEQLQAGQ